MVKFQNSLEFEIKKSFSILVWFKINTTWYVEILNLILILPFPRVGACEFSNQPCWNWLQVCFNEKNRPFWSFVASLVNSMETKPCSSPPSKKQRINYLTSTFFSNRLWSEREKRQMISSLSQFPLSLCCFFVSGRMIFSDVMGNIFLRWWLREVNQTPRCCTLSRCHWKSGDSLLSRCLSFVVKASRKMKKIQQEHNRDSISLWLTTSLSRR